MLKQVYVLYYERVLIDFMFAARIKGCENLNLNLWAFCWIHEKVSMCTWEFNKFYSTTTRLSVWLMYDVNNSNTEKFSIIKRMIT